MLRVSCGWGGPTPVHQKRGRARKSVDVVCTVASHAQREVRSMTFVIAEPCIDVMDQACVRVCPVACIHGDANKDGKLYIDPQRSA